MNEALRTIAIDVVSPTPSNLRQQTSDHASRGYTVSTRGRLPAQRVSDAQTRQKAVISQSPFVMRKGSDGEIGDIAFGLGDGGSFTMDLREDFVKIQYIWDF